MRIEASPIPIDIFMALLMPLIITAVKFNLKLNYDSSKVTVLCSNHIGDNAVQVHTYIVQTSIESHTSVQ